MRTRVLILLAPALMLGACGGGGSGEDPAPAPTTTQAGPGPGPAPTGPTGPTGPEETGAAQTIDVPADAPTIAEAVARATPGSLIRIAPGTYEESVEVPTDKRDLVIRGMDRNRTILDGGDEEVTGLFVHADGVAVENLTVRGYIGNGLVFAPDPDDPGADEPAGSSTEDPYAGAAGGGGGAGSGRLLTGFRASYVTASNNGLYGVYAFAAKDGVFDHVYASGHPDSGIYVGQCRGCNTLVTDSVAEHNMVGYENTNASGVTVTRSAFSRNRVGVALNAQDKERFAPAEDVVITQSVIADNDDRLAPRGSSAFGIGIVLSGAQRSRVQANRVTGHPGPGILVDRSIDGYAPEGNVVRRNRVMGNGTDLALRLGGDPTAPASLGTCFADNVFARSSPERLEARLPCPDGGSGDLALGGLRLPASPANRDYRRVAAPPRQPQMPRPRAAEAAPARDLPARADVRAARAAISLP